MIEAILEAFMKIIVVGGGKVGTACRSLVAETTMLF